MWGPAGRLPHAKGEARAGEPSEGERRMHADLLSMPLSKMLIGEELWRQSKKDDAHLSCGEGQ